jgi:thioesterase domain-containing protein/acyl carrier protein
MLPTAYATLDTWPLTPNGKIDRTALARKTPAEDERPADRTPPRTTTEEQLAVVWREVLEVDEVGIDDDFFELGGHSLLAVRLFSEIDRRLGIRLPLSSLFETTTIRGIAALAEARTYDGDWSTLVQMREGNGEPPLFLIAWAGGEVLPYRDLVEHLNGVPVYGLRAPGVDRRTTPYGTVDELASHYVEEIRRVQPSGPYRLGGFCFSGLVAYEIARKLQTAGEQTSTLALFDSYPFKPPRKRHAFEATRTQLTALKVGGRAGAREWARGRANGIAGRVHRAVYFRVGPRLFEQLAARNLQRFLPRRPWNLVLVASNLARMRYVPTQLDVRVAFFRAEPTKDDRPTPFDSLATGGVVLRRIAGSHDEMMHEPHVRLVAEQLLAELRAPTADPERSRSGATLRAGS